MEIRAGIHNNIHKGMSHPTYRSAPDHMLDAAGDSASNERFLHALILSRAWVITYGVWDGYGKPEGEIQLLTADSQNDQRHPMIAIFTRRQYAEAFLHSTSAARRGFANIAEPPMVWVLLGLPPQAGILINPGSSRAFHLSPRKSAEMRRTAQGVLAQAQQEWETSNPQMLLLNIQNSIDADDIPAAETGIAKLATSGIGEEYVLSSQALVAKYRSDYALAAQLLTKAIDKTRDNVLIAEFYWVLAQVHIDAHEPERAEQAFMQACAHDPGKTSYLVDLARFQAEHLDIEKGLATLRDAVRVYPDDPSLALNIARLLIDAERHEEALSQLDEVLAKYPDAVAAVRFNRAICLQILGRLDEARTSLEEALTLDPNLNGHHQYANLFKASQGKLPASEAYSSLLQRRSQEDMPIASRIDSLFTLSKIYETSGDINRAFECMQRANNLKRSTIKWKIEEASKEFEDIMQLFSRQFVEHFSGVAASDLRPIFVLGMPRSGTTLTEQILAAHSRVIPAGELTYLGKLSTPFIHKWNVPGAASEARISDLVSDLETIASTYTEQTKKLQAQGKRFTDKMPGNFLYLGLIYLLFPGASVIHCHRNPLDNCLSCYERQFSKGLLFSYDLKELGGYYRLYRRLMRHWEAVLPPDYILPVDYELMVNDPENQVRRLLDFCNLEFEPACLNFHEVKRSVKTASVLQVRQPMYKTSVGRWKKYGDRLAPLLEALGPELPQE